MGGTAPVPTAPGLAAGGAADIKWKNNYTGGVYREGCHPGILYTPMFSVVKKRGLFRESPLPPGEEPIVFV